MEDGFFSELMEKGLLVETEITPLKLDGYGMVLKHKKVPTLTYCMEWPATMLKEAALLTLDLAIELTDKNLALQDAYPWNVYFDGTKPEFIDLGSIVEADRKFIWIAYDQFCRFFLYPLYMYAAGREKIARYPAIPLLGRHYERRHPPDHAALKKALQYGAHHPHCAPERHRQDNKKILAGMETQGWKEE